MSLKSIVGKYYAKYKVKNLYTYAANAVDCQEIIMQELVDFAKHTYFGKAHNFELIRNYEDFKNNIPVRDYEQNKRYFDLTAEGKPDILWPGKPIYFAKTSGTTSGAKFIPITESSIDNHLDGAKMALLCSIYHRNNADFVDRKMIFLSGSPELDEKNGVLTGRLSGIVNHHIPAYLKTNQVPDYETNCIEDWETKVDAIVEETKDLDMSLISGIPPWVLMYFEKLLQETGAKTVKEVFPNFDVFVYGGVNFKPYQAQIEETIGGEVAMIETYPASEGFMAFQDMPENNGLLLNINSGIFFEFIPADEIHNAEPTRIMLKDVELNVNYAIILNTNAGLWGYNIGDTVKFVSLDPYRIVVTGRIKHFISAFGEHVIGEEVESALTTAISQLGGLVTEFHVAPKINVESGLPYHEWFIAFEKQPEDLSKFATILDETLQEKNAYYKDLRDGSMLREIVINPLPAYAFRDYMKKQGKLGGQNKVPRLANDRKIADQL